ncbi:MAG: DinB family protein [Bryobacteraceae bacterium]
MSIAEMLLPEFDQEMVHTRKFLARVPEDRFDFQPHPKSATMGKLAAHLATSPAWSVETMNRDSLDFAPPGEPPMSLPEAQNQAQLLELFDDGVTRARVALANATDEQFLQPWTLLGGGTVVFTMPRIAVIRNFVINHTIHHRAQLGVYLRLNDIPVPGVYGPSADES